MARDFIRQVQQLRKDANLEIENRIRVNYFTLDNEVLTMLTEWSKLIRGDTLADSLDGSSDTCSDAKPVNIGSAKVFVWIEKL